MSFDPQNILIINFGQIGDVVLSLPALKAVREKFPAACITAMIGTSGAAIVEISDCADKYIAVDRVKLRDGAKLKSIKEVFAIARDVRRRKFDLIIDLHSLYETNLLGFLSGAKHRLYANRENRSLDFLANFEPKPPREDKNLHLTDHYLQMLQPLGIADAPRFVEIQPRASDLETIENLFAPHQSKRLVGLFPGAGNPSRRWNLNNFADLSRKLAADKTLQTIVFLGPEESNLRAEVEAAFVPETMIVDQLSLLEFVAALSKLTVLVSNDTGAVHLGAIVGAAIVLVIDRRAPITYLPLAEKLQIVNTGTLEQIKSETVYQKVREILEK